MGLGWSADNALDTPMPLVALAVRGRVEMLQNFANYILEGFLGPPEKKPDEPQNVAAQINDIFGKMMEGQDARKG